VRVYAEHGVALPRHLSRHLLRSGTPVNERVELDRVPPYHSTMPLRRCSRSGAVCVWPHSSWLVAPLHPVRNIHGECSAVQRPTHGRWVADRHTNTQLTTRARPDAPSRCGPCAILRGQRWFSFRGRIGRIATMLSHGENRLYERVARISLKCAFSARSLSPLGHLGERPSSAPCA